MSKNRCESCAYARPFGNENDNRCKAWACEYIEYKEAIKAFKEKQSEERIEE